MNFSESIKKKAIELAFKKLELQKQKNYPTTKKIWEEWIASVAMPQWAGL